MSEGVIPDLMALAVDARSYAAEIFGLKPNQEKRCSRLFSLQHIENFRSPLGIRAVIKSNGNSFRIVAIAGHTIGFGQSVHDLVADDSRFWINCDLADSVG